MKEKIAIFLDTKKNSGGAYQKLAYSEKISSRFQENLDISIISTSPTLKIESDKLNLNLLSFNEFL